MRFEIEERLMHALRAWREGEPADRVEQEHDAFCLDPGLGPACYLTSDGRVLIDGRGWDGEPLREATDAEALQTIVIGARKTKVGGLLDLLPPRPEAARDCPRCAGERYASIAPGHPGAPRFICHDCNGVGWVP